MSRNEPRKAGGDNPHWFGICMGHQHLWYLGNSLKYIQEAFYQCRNPHICCSIATHVFHFCLYCSVACVWACCSVACKQHKCRDDHATIIWVCTLVDSTVWWCTPMRVLWRKIILSCTMLFGSVDFLIANLIHYNRGSIHLKFHKLPFDIWCMILIMYIGTELVHIYACNRQ